VLRWFTANIGVHHVHHLCNRSPYYRLPRVLLDHPQLAAVGRLTLLESVECLRMPSGTKSSGGGYHFSKCTPGGRRVRFSPNALMGTAGAQIFGAASDEPAWLARLVMLLIER
jgi:hypothetical protein